MRPFLIAILMLTSAAAYSQGEDTLLNRLMATWDRYSDQHRASGLFLHLDKSLYEHAEHIQFTAWLLDGRWDSSRLQAVYVLLVDPVTRRTVAFDRFALSRYAAAGALYLDDTLHPGKYIVVAYTDDRLQGFDQLFFRQEITLLPNRLLPFRLMQQPDSAQVRLRVSTSYGGLGSGGSFHYRLEGNDRTIDSGDKKIDAFGEVSIAADSVAASAGPVILSAIVNRQDQSSYFWLPVTVRSPEWRVRYYPEGGDLVAGRPCQVGIEIRDATGNPVQTRGRLLENGAAIASFETDNNGWGLLTTMFRPGRSYTADFPDKPAGIRISGSLPALLPGGYSLWVSDGIARDSLNIRLYLPEADLECRLLIYNDREIVYASSLLARASAVHVTIPVKDWPPGLLTMTLFDSRGVPVAERKLYSPAPALLVKIVPDSAVYHPRSRIRLRIQVRDSTGQPVPGLFSLATVLSSRSPGGDADIRRYAFIDRCLPPGQAPGDPGYGLPSANWDNDTTINLLLLIRGWTRYHWEQVAADRRGRPSDQATDYGYVLYRNKKPKAPVTMVVMGGGLTTFETDSAGRFRVPPEELLSEKDNDLALSLAGGNKQEDYRIVLLNRYDSINHFLANAVYLPQPPGLPSPVADRQEVQPFLQAKTLQKAVVTSKSNGYGQSIPGCEDYVCIYNILNCKNHPYGRKPVVGETVLEQTAFGRFTTVVYRACQVAAPAYPIFLSPIKPICLLKEAYINDTTAIPSSVNAHYTTLHWAPLMSTDGSGNAEISFYANDLPGQYDNILQGVSTGGIISGRQSFRIEKEVE